MVEYGYIEDGYLRSKEIEPITERFVDNDGDMKEKIISIQEQIEMLSIEWKPVDLIDPAKMQCGEGCVIRLVPYDAGDHIAYEYRKIPDLQKIKAEINSLKEQLSGGDYKVIKCYEANLLGDALPYDISELHAQRQLLRDKINDLENYYDEMANGK